MNSRAQLCLVIGTPRGFTRSVLEALLKRGSRVILACPDPALAHSEHKRLSSLYGSAHISVNVIEPTNTRTLESLLLRALDTHGGITSLLNSTADDKLRIDRKYLHGKSFDELENDLNKKQQQHDVQAIRRISKLAVKYMGVQNGFEGGSFLNLVSSTELRHNIKTDSELCTNSEPDLSSCSALNCTALGTTRALGLSKHVDFHGVRTATVYQPNIDYPELTMASQITDDEHSPYYPPWNRYSAYCREYTGYMALHVAETAASGSAWRFNQELRLQQVDPTDLPSSCKLANKMCYWLGCPHVQDLSEQHQEASREQQQAASQHQAAPQHHAASHVQEAVPDTNS